MKADNGNRNRFGHVPIGHRCLFLPTLNQTMKLICNVAIALAIIGLTPIPEMALVGCKTTGVVSKQEAADQILLRSEQTTETAFETFNLFVHLEKNNEAALKIFNPEIHKYAEKVRRNGRAWIQSVLKAHDAFKASRTTENEASLSTYLITLNAGLSEVQKYLDQSKSVTNP